MAKSVDLLSAVKVRQEKRFGRHHDGGGLYLEIDEHGRRWALRLTIGGKRTWVGLGPVSDMSLAEARQEAQERRRAARAGDVAKTHQRAPRVRLSVGTTFRQAFYLHFEEIRRPRLDPDYAATYPNAVEQLLMPTIGDLDVGHVQPKHIIAALTEPWGRIPTRARKVAQRASLVFLWARAKGLRQDDEPVRDARAVLGKERPKVEHRPSIAWEKAPWFLRWLRERPMAHPSTLLCLEMILATALRSREARLARWHEFDLQAREWTVPGHDEVEAKERGFLKKRMKMGLMQVVPLSPLAMDVLERAEGQRLSNASEALVFPSITGEVISDNTMSKLLRDSNIDGTPHGLRATLRTWCQEMKVNHDVAEKLLSHGEPDLTIAAYKRATHYDERRVVLNQWSNFLTGSPCPGSM